MTMQLWQIQVDQNETNAWSGTTRHVEFEEDSLIVIILNKS